MLLRNVIYNNYIIIIIYKKYNNLKKNISLKFNITLFLSIKLNQYKITQK